MIHDALEIPEVRLAVKGTLKADNSIIRAGHLRGGHGRFFR